MNLVVDKEVDNLLDVKMIIDICGRYYCLLCNGSIL